MRAEGPQHDPHMAAASDWLTRIRLEAASPKEQADFAAWLAASPDHRSAFAAVDALWQRAEGLKQVPEAHALLHQSAARAPFLTLLKGALIRHARLLLGGAAGVAAALILIVAVSDLSWPTSPGTVATQVAEIREVSLPDGSIITLGALSTLHYSFTEDERRIRLQDGEAFFAVEKDLARPFFVEAGGTLVRVVGTRFNVRIGPDSVQVAVEEGQVELVPIEADLESDTAPPSPAVLTGGEQIIASLHGQMAQVEDIPLPSAWREGRLDYAGARLVDVIADARRYHNGDIRITDAALNDLRVTTSFRTDEIDLMVETLGDVLPLTVTKRDNGDLLLSPQHN